MKKRPLRVGFDLDGVILYNPARITRPLVALIKKAFLKKRRLKFYVPHSPHEQLLWRIFHWSSLFIASGFHDIKPLAQQNLIEAYIVTARYDFLKDDFHAWVKRAKVPMFFKGWYHNEKNEQPHVFKERMISELNLDVFVEDNLDIVLHLQKKFPDKMILWIYNILDRQHLHSLKFPSLKHAVSHIKTHIIKKSA